MSEWHLEKPQAKPQSTPCREKLKSVPMATVKHKVLHFMLYWVSIYYLISGSKRLQLKQKDISKYLTPFFLTSSVWDCQLLWGFDYKGKKGLDWFKMWCVGALQSREDVSQEPQRREKRKENAAPGRPRVRSLGTLLVTRADLGNGWKHLGILKMETWIICLVLPNISPFIVLSFPIYNMGIKFNPGNGASIWFL